MDLTRKLELLDQQIADANGGSPTNFDSWRNRTDVVLRTVLGADSPIYVSFDEVRYFPGIWFDGMDTSGYQPAGVREVVGLLQSAKLELELLDEVAGASRAESSTHASPAAMLNRVFVVHGHDDGRKHETARLIEDLTAVRPTILHEQPNKGRVVIEKFEAHASEAGFAVVLLTADDLGRAKADRDDRPRARQNVVLEMGFFIGSFGRDRIAVLHESDVELPSDLAGIVYIALDAAGAWKTKLAGELDAAGFTIDWSALGR